MQTLIMWLIFLGLGPLCTWHIENLLGFARWRFAFEHQLFFGIFTFCCSAALAWGSAYFLILQGQGTPLPADAPRHLVIAGPYRFVRNPMAMGSLAQGLAIGIGLGSPLVLIYGFIGILAWNYIARPWEEFDLARRFGAPYEDYRDSVRCWIPRLHAYQGEDKTLKQHETD
ncbi:MAG TPA: isoprenylcysteine carboxylmethyltransferase family protein [Abditibacteriaceae bacterium]|jgi:protein-S-isoprenylcysteine O-methyltransferase Ste14